MTGLVIDLEPPTKPDKWLHKIWRRLKKGPFALTVYTVAELTTANLVATKHGDGSTWTTIVGVSDETGGFCLAFSDGTNWKRAHDPTTTIS